MGKILDVLIGDKNRLDEPSYNNIDNRDTKTHNRLSVEFGFAEINSKSDMLEVGDAARSGYAVISEVRDLDDGLTKNQVADYLSDICGEVGSDVAWKSDDRESIIVAPPTVTIQRERITS